MDSEIETDPASRDQHSDAVGIFLPRRLGIDFMLSPAKPLTPLPPQAKLCSPNSAVIEVTECSRTIFRLGIENFPYSRPIQELIVFEKDYLEVK